MEEFLKNLRGAIGNIGKVGGQFIENLRNSYEENQRKQVRPDAEVGDTFENVGRRLQQGGERAYQGTLFADERQIPDLKFRNLDAAATAVGDSAIARNADILDDIIDRLENTTSLTERKKIIDNGKKKIKGSSSGLDTWFKVAEDGAYSLYPVQNPNWYNDELWYGTDEGRTGKRQEIPTVLNNFTDSMQILRDLTKTSRARYYRKS